MKSVKRKCICCNGTGFVKSLRDDKKLTKKQKNQIIPLYKSGLGIREIQRKLKIKSPYSVSYYLKTFQNKQ